MILICIHIYCGLTLNFSKRRVWIFFLSPRRVFRGWSSKDPRAGWNAVPIHYFHSRDWSIRRWEKKKAENESFTKIGGHRFRIYSPTLAITFRHINVVWKHSARNADLSRVCRLITGDAKSGFLRVRSDIIFCLLLYGQLSLTHWEHGSLECWTPRSELRLLMLWRQSGELRTVGRCVTNRTIVPRCSGNELNSSQGNFAIFLAKRSLARGSLDTLTYYLTISKTERSNTWFERTFCLYYELTSQHLHWTTAEITDC